jgi:signal transduction histidine kinase
MRRGLTVRSRLTVLYSALFLIAGGLLVAGMVWSVRDSLYADVTPSGSPEFDKAMANGLDKQEAYNELRAQVRDRTMRQLGWNAGVALVALGALSGAAGAMVSGRLLARVRNVTEAARAASDINLNLRLNLPGPRDEIKDLGDTFDAMLARLDGVFEAQRRFVANASHELRTPLAVTRTAAEVTLAKPHATVSQLRTMGQEVCVEMARAERLVDSLLVLSRSEQWIGEAEADDFADLATDALDGARRETTNRGIRVRAELAPAPAAGDLALLSRAVANLVENAVRHNCPGGEVTVQTGNDAGQSWVRVANTGTDLTTMDVDRLFEPFNRGARTRLDGEGAGLGLSIVAAVARVHGGTVWACPRPVVDGGGLVVTLQLPHQMEIDALRFDAPDLAGYRDAPSPDGRMSTWR